MRYIGTNGEGARSKDGFTDESVDWDWYTSAREAIHNRARVPSRFIPRIRGATLINHFFFLY